MNTMNATQKLHGLGQSLWLDNITRNLLQGGLLRRYIDELSVTGLTSNPTIFDHAIKNSTDYDVAICEKLGEGKPGEQLFFEPLGKLIRRRISGKIGQRPFRYFDKVTWL